MLYEKLYGFQKSIVDKFKSKKRFGLFLDMGLGKTITSLSLCEVNNIDRIIVVSIKSKSTESQFIKGSFADYLNQLDFTIYNKNKDNKFIDTFSNDEKEAFILNYESFITKDEKLPWYIKEFLEKDCVDKKVAIILDESHKIKNSSSKTSKNIRKFINIVDKYCDLYLYLLTGTPFTQGFIDLHNQLNLIGWNISKTAFIDKYGIRGNIAGLYNWQQPIVGYRNVDELFEIVQKYAITELTENNIKLPDQIFVDIELPQSLEFEMFVKNKYSSSKLHSYLLKNRKCDIFSLIDKKKLPILIENPLYRNFNYPDDSFFAGTSASFWMRSRQLSIGFQGNEDNYVWYNYDRVNKLKEFLENNKDNYVIFYNYTPELKVIFEVCEELGYSIDIYCGDIKTLQYYEQYEKMNDDEKFNNKKRVIISNFASGSEGKNWQAYNKVIFFSIPLYGEYAQSLKRVHRIGQTKTVYYYTFYQNNFLDKSMIKALQDNVDYNYKMFEYNIERDK